MAASLLIPGAEGNRWTGRIVGLACLAFLTAACYGEALFRGGQFAFRDAAHFYYPLNERVQREWAAGRLPLWEPGENGGAPLLGSPMAAVLYPGKVLFALVPYPWGVRLYVVSHELLACAAMLLLARSWRISRTGSTLAGLGYAFGGPVLSNYYNVIYLVGAAWAPLGFRAADRWLRLGRRSALAELALVLAMQVLGGDPEAAYVTSVCAFGYAVGLASGAMSRRRAWSWGLGVPALLVAWAWVGPSLTSRLHGAGPRFGQTFLVAAWTVAISLYVASRPPGRRLGLCSMLAGLAAACFLAIMLAGMQILPVVHHISGSVRWAGSGLVNLYEASLLPYRAVEWAWPNVFGSFTAGNRYWMALLPPAGTHRPAPLSLYMGSLPLVLALGGAGFRNGPPWRAWMTVVAFATFTAGLGQFAGPSAWSAGDPTLPGIGDDSFYGFLTTILPLLRLFRLPYKMLVFTSLAMAILAGAGWDRVVAGVDRVRTLALTGSLLAFTVLVFAIAFAQRDRIIAAMAERPEAVSEVFGPLDAPGAANDLLQNLIHVMFTFAAAAIVIGWSVRDPSRAGVAAVLFLSADLAWANARLVITSPQSDFEQVPEVVQAIRRAEEADPSPGPFRVHRLASWVPTGWSREASPRRLRDLVAWEIDTLQPRFGLLHGVSYLLNDESRTEELDYWSLFQPSFRRVPAPTAAAMGVEPGRRVLWHPRQAFDLWGARYFVLPSSPGDWTSPNRSYAAFLDQTELIYPDPASLEGPAHQDDRREWLRTRDVQVRKNRAAFPRAWIVHQAHLIEPLERLPDAARAALLERLRSGNDPARAAPGLAGTDFRAAAYVETAAPRELATYLNGTGPDPAESVVVHPEGSARVVLEARLNRPGLVILADSFNDGWQLTVDGRPAPVLRANLLMRAAAVPAGPHTLVYTYNPRSVQIGAIFSAAGLALLLALILWASLQPRSSSASG